jgi:hypothetical protein
MLSGLHIDQYVRLASDLLPIARGSVGIVIGFYAREPITCLVSFDGAAYEVAPEDLEAIDDAAAT